MLSEGALDGGDDPLFVKALVAGLAALCAAALAMGMADGAPLERPRGLAAAAPGPEAGLTAAGRRGPAAPPPVLRLCFHGPRGEPVDFPVAQYCPEAAAP